MNIPEGWQLVPVKSTYEMRMAMNNVPKPHSTSYAGEQWDAALKAAPTSPPPSRAEFERLIKAQTPTAQLDRAENGEYIVPSLRMMWEGYCMAMQPAREAETVEPIGRISQYADERRPNRWYDCPHDDLKYYAERGDKTRVLYMYVDHPALYTRPANYNLRQAAEEMISKLAWMRQFLSYGHTQDIVRRELTEAGDKLKAALEGKS